MKKCLYPVMAYYYKSVFSGQLIYVLVSYENDCYAESTYSFYNYPYIKYQKRLNELSDMSQLISILKSDNMKKISLDDFENMYA